MKSLFRMFMIQSSKTRDFYSAEINRSRSIHREEKISTRATQITEFRERRDDVKKKSGHCFRKGIPFGGSRNCQWDFGGENIECRYLVKKAGRDVIF